MVLIAVVLWILIIVIWITTYAKAEATDELTVFLLSVASLMTGLVVGVAARFEMLSPDEYARPDALTAVFVPLFSLIAFAVFMRLKYRTAETRMAGFSSELEGVAWKGLKVIDWCATVFGFILAAIVFFGDR